MARRFDRAEFGKVERLPTGGIRVPAALARTGIQVYRNPNGTPRREYRPPEEVFAAHALDALRGSPVTHNHPATGRVDASDWRVLAVGHVGEDVRQDGAHVVASVYVQDADTIAEIEAGTLRQVSLGYDVDYDPTPGVTPEGEHYDGVQRNIRPNHTALVPRGRAGDTVGLRLDHEDNQIPEGQEPPNVRKIKVNGVEIEVSDEAAEAFEALSRRADSAETEAKAAKAIADKARAAAIAAQVKPLGVTVRLDATPAEMMIETLKKLAPGVSLEGASDEFVMGAFAAAVALKLGAEESEDEPAEGDEPAPQAPPGPNAASVRADVFDARLSVPEGPKMAAPGQSPSEIARAKMGARPQN
jgi:uncharacterized protein